MRCAPPFLWQESTLKITCLSFLQSFFIGNRQAFTTLRAACLQYFTAVFGSHTGTETVLVHALSSRWLISPFHYISFYPSSKVGQR